MARITVEDCIDKFESRFELVLVAANRARKIHSGETPTVEKDNDKNTVIALREIADETIPADELKEKLIEEYQTVSIQNEEDISLEYSDKENVDDEDKNVEKSNSDEIIENTLLDLKNESQPLSDIEYSETKENTNNQSDNLSKNTEEQAN